MNRRSRYDTWIAVFAIIGALVVIAVLYRLLTAGLQSYVALIAGALLVLGNLPELLRALQGRVWGAALMNTLIGLALISYFLAALLPWLFYPLAILLLLAAVPLAVNRTDVARAYLRGARTLGLQLRQMLRARQRTL
ncbi:hypothetical protein [Kallotenue papyrolyticum]|uniref:hypothetical protein n=1 Tax=Kallotenue papyrolyticum TaxID=1325125 RepID=UPI00049240BF|nr:hypothetical protein [Kallotenue papyrolyticum]